MDASELWEHSPDHLEITQHPRLVLACTPTGYQLEFDPQALRTVLDSNIVEMATFTNPSDGEDLVSARGIMEDTVALVGCTGVLSSAALPEPGKVDRFVSVIGRTSIKTSKKADKTKYISGRAPETPRLF
ncbi:hypothetical protein EDB80DRAFT_898533 [Ilyonectria destructans]|nr:hypothetical protein EDB80DRAFT_898533 [Ilyonectria destructans]